MSTHKEHDILIVGGGTGGIMVAAQLLRKDPGLDVAIIEPSDTHYYQAAWTLVGAGTFDLKETARPMAGCIPPRARWIKDRVSSFEPGRNRLSTSGGLTITYRYLVVSPGVQINWGAVKGLPETIGKNGVCSVYDYHLTTNTWKTISSTKEGNVIFTQPNTPVKCGGAPQKIMYLADEALRRNGVRQDVDIQFFSPGTVVFGVEHFAKTLRKVIREKGIHFHLGHNLTEVRGEEKIAVFDVTGADGSVEKKEVPFSMLHVVPPMSAPDFIRNSALAIEEGPLKGWVDVDLNTLQHNRFPNVFGIGDAAGLPTAKTGSAIRKQAPVVVDNILRLRERDRLAAMKGAVAERQTIALGGAAASGGPGGTTGSATEITIEFPDTEPVPLNNSYKGYSSCPLVTGYGKMVLAEFDYQNQPDPTFPFDQSEERYDMYVLKKFGLPWMYWNLMLKGKA